MHFIKAEGSELLTPINLIDSLTLVRTNPSLSFSAPYFSFFFYKQENGYEGLQGKQSELWDIFKIQFNIPSVPSKYECMYHFFWADQSFFILANISPKESIFFISSYCSNSKSWRHHFFLKNAFFQNDNFCINDK